MSNTTNKKVSRPKCPKCKTLMQPRMDKTKRADTLSRETWSCAKCGEKRKAVES